MNPASVVPRYVGMGIGIINGRLDRLLSQTVRFRVSADGVIAESKAAQRLMTDPLARERTAALLRSVHGAFDARWSPDEFVVSFPLDDRHLAAELVRRFRDQPNSAARRSIGVAATERALRSLERRPWGDTGGTDIVMWPVTARPLLASLTGAPEPGSKQALGDAVHALVHERGHTLNQATGGVADVIEGYVETLTQWPGTIEDVVRQAGLPPTALMGACGYPEGVKRVRGALARLGIDPNDPASRATAEAIFANTEIAHLDRVLGIRPVSGT